MFFSRKGSFAFTVLQYNFVNNFAIVTFLRAPIPDSQSTKLDLLSINPEIQYRYSYKTRFSDSKLMISHFILFYQNNMVSISFIVELIREYALEFACIFLKSDSKRFSLEKTLHSSPPSDLKYGKIKIRVAVRVGIFSLGVVRLHLDIAYHRWQLIDSSMFIQTMMTLFGKLAPSECSL
uniref:Uncharacterized protein n=1 Tax=Salix viminalis TaxID=40686 RepID=A0A6N2LDM2_SALVM